MVGVGDSSGRGMASYAVGGPAAGGLFDFSSVFTWRVILALAALSYIVGFHVTLPGIGRVRI